MSRNVVYRSPEIARHYSTHRNHWEELYPSERWVLERVSQGKKGCFDRVLDVGCACGGLLTALTEKCRLTTYVGVDINEQAIESAKARPFPIPAKFYTGDIVDLGKLPGAPFDIVFSLGCADWNLESEAMITSCWENVAPGGQLIISLRLTREKTVKDIQKSFQWISFESTCPENTERANYVVYNADDALKLFQNLVPCPKSILGYGYWGTPSEKARTPFDRVVFSVFAITRPRDTKVSPSYELLLPSNLLTQ